MFNPPDHFLPVLLQNGVGPQTLKFYFPLASAIRRSQAVSNTRLMITASGLG